MKEHLVCIDQLRALSVTFGRRITFFKDLLKDLDEIAAEDIRKGRVPKINNPDGETAQSRIDWALSVCNRNKTIIDLLLDDITRSIDTVSLIHPPKEIPNASRLTTMLRSSINCKHSIRMRCKSYRIVQTKRSS